MVESQQMKVEPLKKNMSCAGCRHAKRRCSPDCFLSPYFPGNNPQRFECVRKIYGAKNLTKMLEKVPLNQRALAAETLYREANSRIKDPVHGCYGEIANLNQKIHDAQSELAKIRAQITVLGSLSMQNSDNLPSYGVPDEKFVMCFGNKRRRSYKGLQKTQVQPGTFKTEENAAMAYDEPFWKLHGHRARLKIPDCEAVPHVSCADFAQLVSSAEMSFSAIKINSQSVPGPVSTPIPHKDGPNQSAWNDEDFDYSLMSLLFEALDTPIQQTFGVEAALNSELQYGSARQYTLNHNPSEDDILPWPYQNTDDFIEATERYVEDTKVEHLRLRDGSCSEMKPLQDGRAVHHDGSKLVVKVESCS